MTTGLQMFLIAAQELNFTRAAQKAFVTPQCLSDHIKRLEEQYQVTLFRRRPHLQLTAEGETMVRYLTRIQALENTMSNELADISGGVRNVVHLRGDEIRLPGLGKDVTNKALGGLPGNMCMHASEFRRQDKQVSLVRTCVGRN